MRIARLSKRQSLLLPPNSTAPSQSSVSSTKSSSADTRPSLSATNSTLSGSKSIPYSTPILAPTFDPNTSTNSDGVAPTMTSFQNAGPSSTNVSSPPSSGFLQQKALSGTVFATIGVVGLVMLITLCTLSLRRRRNNRLIEEAVSFDPAVHMEAAKIYDEKTSLRGAAAPPPSSHIAPSGFAIRNSPSLRAAPSARVHDDYGYYPGLGSAHPNNIGQYPQPQHYDHMGQYSQNYGPPPGYP